MYNTNSRHRPKENNRTKVKRCTCSVSTPRTALLFQWRNNCAYRKWRCKDSITDLSTSRKSLIAAISKSTSERQWSAIRSQACVGPHAGRTLPGRTAASPWHRIVKTAAKSRMITTCFKVQVTLWIKKPRLICKRLCHRKGRTTQLRCDKYALEVSLCSKTIKMIRSILLHQWQNTSTHLKYNTPKKQWSGCRKKTRRNWPWVSKRSSNTQRFQSNQSNRQKSQIIMQWSKR